MYSWHERAPRQAWRSGLHLVAVTAAALAAPFGSALAQSGDFPLTPGDASVVPTYSIPAATCNTIRNALQPGDTSPFDLVVACSIEGRGSPGRESPCDLLGGGVNAGVPLGQCLDSFPVPLTQTAPDQGFLEREVALAASAGGLNLALSDGDRVSVTSVAGSVGRVQGIIKVSPGSCGTGECPSVCGGVDVVASATACNEVTAQLRAAVLEDPPALSHALFFDVEQTSASDFMSVAVCPSYKWTCLNPDPSQPSPAVPALDVDYLGQLSFSIAYTPVCFRTSRLGSYCCATYPNGTVVQPCPSK